MNEVGRRFKANEFYVPEVLLAARAMHGAMSILKPLLVAENKVEPRGVVVLGTVKGDLHDIGKNLVGMMLEGSGFQVVDAGVDVAPEKFVAAVKESKPDVIAMSALLTTTMTNMKTTVQALDEAGVRKSVKVMVGGAPLTQRYADEIGADGYAPDAASAAELAGTLNRRASRHNPALQTINRRGLVRESTGYLRARSPHFCVLEDTYHDPDPVTRRPHSLSSSRTICLRLSSASVSTPPDAKSCRQRCWPMIFHSLPTRRAPRPRPAPICSTSTSA